MGSRPCSQKLPCSAVLRAASDALANRAERVMLLQHDLTFSYDGCAVRAAILRKISLLVPTLAQAVVYKRLSCGWGWVAQLKTQGSVVSESWPRLLVWVSVIDSCGIHVNV